MDRSLYRETRRARRASEEAGMVTGRGCRHAGPRIGVNAVNRISRNGAALATTVSGILRRRFPSIGPRCSFGRVSSTPRRTTHNVAVGVTRVRCRARGHRCTRISYPNRTSFIGGVVANTTRVSNTVLIITTASNPVTRAHRRILLTHRINIPGVLITLGGYSVISSRRLVRLIRRRIHSLLSRGNFSHSYPIVRASTCNTLRSSTPSRRG